MSACDQRAVDGVRVQAQPAQVGPSTTPPQRNNKNARRKGKEKISTREECKPNGDSSYVLLQLNENAQKRDWKITWKDEQDCQLWHSTLTIQEGAEDPVELHTDRGKGYKQKQHAKADLARRYLQRHRIPTERYRIFELPHSEPSKTELSSKQAFDQYCTQRRITAKFSFRQCEEEKRYYLDLECKLAETPFKTSKGPSSSKSDLKHKASKSMLKLMAPKDDLAIKYYLQLRKTPAFRRGDIFPFEEDHRTEFKGGQNETAVWKLDQVLAVIQDKGKSLAAYVSAFLNSKNGGSLWYGIHDKTKVIHGIYLGPAEHDRLRRAINDQLGCIWPDVAREREVSASFHPVLLYPDQEFQRPERWECSEEVTRYIHSLETQIKELKEKLQPLLQHQSQEKCFLLRVTVMPGVRDELSWAGSRVWEKVDSALVKMKPQGIKARVREEAFREWTTNSGSELGPAFKRDGDHMHQVTSKDD